MLASLLAATAGAGPGQALRELPAGALVLVVAAAAIAAGGARRRGRGRSRAQREWYRRVYLNSAHWRATRARAFARAGGRCQRCHRRPPREVHHRTYARLGRERDRDLEALCDECHQARHRQRDRARRRRRGMLRALR
jgi:5-methylcytosine-specific restriction endonuclease McrA